MGAHKLVCSIQLEKMDKESSKREPLASKFIAQTVPPEADKDKHIKSVGLNRKQVCVRGAKVLRRVSLEFRR